MAEKDENLVQRRFMTPRGLIAIGLVALIVAGLVVMFLYTKGPEYQVLYANLSAEDSGAVIDRLKEKRVPYRVDGTTISVEAGRTYEMRMELAGEGIPQGGGVGFEIFDKTGFGVTDFVQKVNYRRALQGELSRTIAQIKEIESARVHLAIPDKGVFMGTDDKKTRASIVVKLRSGKTLSQGQVAAIVHLVASSFENLKTDDVTVVDTSGRLWTKGSEEAESPAGLTSAQLDYKRSFERDLEQRVQSMLEKTVGLNKVVARVSVDVNSKQVEKTEETFDPNSQVIRSEQRNTEKTVGSSATAGVPGVLSNIPDSQGGAAGQSSPSETNRKDEVINYEISKVISRTVEPVNSIRKLTVAVLVDGTYEVTKAEDGTEVRKFLARGDDDTRKFTEMVKAAVGYDEARGDKVMVVSAPFEGEIQEAPLAQEEKAPLIPAFMMPFVPTAIKYVSLLLIAALVILFVLKPAVRRLLEEGSYTAAMPKGLSEGAMRQMLESGGSPTDVVHTDDSVDKLKKLVRENPQQAAMILKGWVKDK